MPPGVVTLRVNVFTNVKNNVYLLIKLSNDQSVFNSWHMTVGRGAFWICDDYWLLPYVIPVKRWIKTVYVSLWIRTRIFEILQRRCSKFSFPLTFPLPSQHFCPRVWNNRPPPTPHDPSSILPTHNRHSLCHYRICCLSLFRCVCVQLGVHPASGVP